MMKQTVTTAFIAIATAAMLTSCVAKRKLVDSEIKVRLLKSDSALQANQINLLQGELDSLKGTNSSLYNQNSNLQNKLSAANSDAEQKKSQLQQSKQQIEEQQRKLAQLQALIDQQKAASAELRKKMAVALGGFTSNELTISTKNGKVYVSLQENLLFPSGSAKVNEMGKTALAKLAEVLNVNPDISVNIEGHTDSIPIKGRFEDNWALSVARATSIVRVLVNEYKVDATRVVASGHSQFDPVQPNGTPEGRAKNRRTEIILTPKLNELYNLLEGVQ
ncbi:chemotaxis protein MotB [Filimonas lacunae]|uniref:Chemotaxis protein MotB n=1 Tax=Filimonas lacunae TaxID=477680 RepID=A0A173MBC0_9BACT|nr:OmpA family protein [Filimonas lacunae]BAV04810.1 flagellar motor rotation protein MotB [Filimonas lacunae]SIT34733.1 chemotaxis protein MotB [Filimonas lacunae]